MSVPALDGGPPDEAGRRDIGLEYRGESGRSRSARPSETGEDRFRVRRWEGIARPCDGSDDGVDDGCVGESGDDGGRADGIDSLYQPPVNVRATS